MGLLRHKFVYPNYRPFQTPGSAGTTVLERCSRQRGAGHGTYGCSIYVEGRERQPLQMETDELRGWLR